MSHSPRHTSTVPLDQALQTAIALHKAGQLQQAGTIYRTILNASSNHPDANHNLGVLLVQTGDLPAALPHFKAALEANSSEVQFWLSYVQALIKAGKIDDAGQVLNVARQAGISGTAIESLENLVKANRQVEKTAAVDSTALVQAGREPARHEAPADGEIAALAALYTQGHHIEAESRARVLTTQFPQHPFGWKILGVLLRTQGKIEEAMSAFQQALQLQPNDADTHYNLANILREQRHYPAAEVGYRRALEIMPTLTVAHYNLGNTLQEQGRFVDAEESFRRTLALNPNHAEAYCNLGNALQDQGRLSEAEASYRQALKIKPDFVGALSNLGLNLLDQGRFDDAEACHRRASEIQRGSAGVHNNLGLTLSKQGRLLEAEACFREALRIKPDFGDALNNLGNILKEQGHLTAAESTYHQAFKSKPEDPAILNNIGNIHREQNRLTDAEAFYRRALEKAPQYADAYSNLGTALKEQGRLIEAEKCFRHALALKPNHAEAHNNLGNILKDLGNLAEAKEHFRAALESKPDYLDAFSNLLGALNYSANHSPEFCREEAERFGQLAADKMLRHGMPFHSWTCAPQPERLRVGLVSGDLRSHPVGYFLEGLLAHINQAQMELVAYPTNHREDELTHRIRPYFSKWTSLLGLSDEAAARLIHHDRIHILIDLSGHTAYNRLPVFAWKPAPVQVSWLGYFATTGIAAMDYLLADETGVPENQHEHFTESIWHLPDTRLCFTPPDKDMPVAPLPALQSGYVTFGSFQALPKVTNAVLALWGRVFSALPQARLRWQCRQFNDAEVVEQTLLRLQRQGIDPEQVSFHKPVSRASYLEAHAEVDMILDSFPYPGGTTTCEALWMGVPTLTLAGDRLHARQGASLLCAAGLKDWVAHDETQFVEMAVSFAGKLPELSALRACLRNQLATTPLFNGKLFADNLQAALWRMWREKQNIQPARDSD